MAISQTAPTPRLQTPPPFPFFKIIDNFPSEVVGHPLASVVQFPVFWKLRPGTLVQVELRTSKEYVFILAYSLTLSSEVPVPARTKHTGIGTWLGHIVQGPSATVAFCSTEAVPSLKLPAPSGLLPSPDEQPATETMTLARAALMLSRRPMATARGVAKRRKESATPFPQILFDIFIQPFPF
jgi:hypothetical protein